LYNLVEQLIKTARPSNEDVAIHI